MKGLQEPGTPLRQLQKPLDAYLQVGTNFEFQIEGGVDCLRKYQPA